MKRLLLLALLAYPLSGFGQLVDLSTGTKGILPKSKGGTEVNSSNTFAQTGVDINTSFQVVSLHLAGPTGCTGSQFAVGIDSSGNAVCATPVGSGNVSTTGSPASGNLAKFSGATTITNGDLSGDVTTSGTLASTIAALAVTTAKINTAAVTEGKIGLSDVTTNNVTSTAHGFAPKSPADATQFLNGAATNAYAQVKDSDLSTSDVTTNNVSSTKHGFTPKSPADATQFLNGAATNAYAQVKDSDLSTSDVTTNNVSITKHGFAPKAPNDATKFLDGTGAYSVPAVAAFQVNGTPLSSASTINFQSSGSPNGLAVTFTNPAVGDVTLGLSGTLNNGGLTNSSTTVNGATCALGGTCTANPATDTNCANGASPAVCASAASGAVAVPTGVNPTLVINTTKVTANSRIFLTVDESLTIAATTCNTTLSTLVQPVVTARSAGVSFTIQIGATIAANPACVSYEIVN